VNSFLAPSASTDLRHAAEESFSDRGCCTVATGPKPGNSFSSRGSKPEEKSHQPTLRWTLFDHLQQAPDSHCSLSGAPSGAALTLRALSAHCSRSLFTFADDRWRSSRCSAWHTGQSGATPDSLVNYSGVALQKPEAEQFRVDLPGAPDTVRWHTGQSDAPDQGIFWLVLLLSFWTLTLTFYWFVLNLWHL
jgi:hypothetical protein